MADTFGSFPVTVPKRACCWRIRNSFVRGALQRFQGVLHLEQQVGALSKELINLLCSAS